MTGKDSNVYSAYTFNCESCIRSGTFTCSTNFTRANQKWHEEKNARVHTHHTHDPSTKHVELFIFCFSSEFASFFPVFHFYGIWILLFQVNPSVFCDVSTSLLNVCGKFKNNHAQWNSIIRMHWNIFQTVCQDDVDYIWLMTLISIWTHDNLSMNLFYNLRILLALRHTFKQMNNDLPIWCHFSRIDSFVSSILGAKFNRMVCCQRSSNSLYGVSIPLHGPSSCFSPYHLPLNKNDSLNLNEMVELCIYTHAFPDTWILIHARHWENESTRNVVICM